MAWAERLRELYRALIRGELSAAFLTVVLCASFFLATVRIRHDSPTEDEWAHLVRGVSYWQNRDMRVHVQHPPLANAFDTIPIAFDRNNPRTADMPTWKNGYPPAGEYIKVDYARARSQLMRCRYMAVLFLTGLCAYAFFFCEVTFGWPTAACVLLLLAFNPTLLGQARYVATDLPEATLWTIGVGEAIRYLGARSRWTLVTMALGLSGAALAKHSGVLLIPIVTLIALAVALLGRGRFAGLGLSRRLLKWFGEFALAGLIVLFAINAIYKFDRTNLTVREFLAEPEQRHWTTSGYHQNFLEQRTFLPKLPQGLRIPLPHPYLFGLFTIEEHNRRGYPTYFMGKSSTKGEVWYFPVLLVLKNPLALLVLLASGAWILLRRRRLSMPSAIVFSVSLALLFVLMKSNLNMGIRHALPMIPLLSILGGRAFAHLPEVATRHVLAGLRVLGLSSVVSALASVPHYLGFFNLLAFGRGNQIAVVGDDWGQDREDFVRFARAHKLSPLYYYTETGTRKLEVDFLGLEFKELGCRTRLPAGAWAAVHLQYVYRWQSSGCAPWIKALEPSYVVDGHINIYHLPAASSELRPGKELEAAPNEPTPAEAQP
jgi:4-amino-4-deoxy-L-arabinose transferase-like glycosyltransferase